MLKRKITKVSSSVKALLKSGKNPKKFLLCKECDTVEVEVSFDTAAVTCAYCVQRQLPPPIGVKPKSEVEKFPRGWALKARYVHIDGRVFEKGKETGEVVTPDVPTSKKEKKVTKKKVTKKKTPKRRK
jgi:hypothetical protein